MKKIILPFALSILVSSSVVAEEEQALNLCVAAIGGDYYLNYEYLHDNVHGLGLRLEYVPGSNSDMSSISRAVAMNYRWHLSPNMESIFIGVFGRYRVTPGSGTVGGSAFDFEVVESTVGLNIGKRWVWDNGFNILFAFGYGMTEATETISTNDASVASAFKAYKKEGWDVFDNATYGELSIGYVF